MGDTLFYSIEGPLDSIPDENQMRTANFDGFADLVRQRGSDPRRILDHHGLDPRAITDPDYYIDCQSFVDVFEYCSKIFDDPLFGLRLAEHQQADVFGCVTALCRAAPTMREAVQGFAQYLPVVHSPGCHHELFEGRDAAELRWRLDRDLGANHQATYQGVLLAIKLLELIGGKAFKPAYVNITADASAKYVPVIENIIGCKFNPKASNNSIGFSAAALDQPVPTANKLLYRLLGGYLDRVKESSRTSIVHRVQDYVRGALPSGNCSIERCAKKLGASVRTLQSHLAEHGLRFSDIVERQRIELAKKHLEHSQISLDELAALLGYSEQSSFGRAFKRWTGSTPQRFRAMRGPADSRFH